MSIFKTFGLAGLHLGITVGTLLFAGSTARAQQRIGEANTIHNQVVRVSLNQSSPLSQGGSIYRDETIRTGRDSAARLVFLDQTNLSLGSDSQIKLDKFVYSADDTARAATINIVLGTFRFTTGLLDKKAYRVITPVATMGVRGTVLDIQTRGNTTQVTLRDNGAVLVCANATSRCIELDRPSQSVIVTNRTVRLVKAKQAFNFDATCTRNPGLCSPIICD